MVKQIIHNVKDLLEYINKINGKWTSSSNIDKDESHPVSQQVSQKKSVQTSTATDKLSSSATDNQEPGPSYQKCILQGKYTPAKTSQKPLLKYKK